MSSFKTPSILLVDDEEVIRTLLTRALVTHDYTVDQADTRAAAVALINEREYDLLLLDKNLPDGSGLDVIAAARRRGHKSETILITAYSDTESAIQAVSLGVFRYVRKPFDLRALTVDINKALETGRLRRDLARRTAELEVSNEALARSESRYRMLFNSGHDAVFVYPLTEDGDSGSFIEVNDVACSWLGYGRERLLESNIEDLDASAVQLDWSSLVAKLMFEQHVLFEMELKTRDGRHIPVEVAARSFQLGDRLSVMAIARDIAERRRGEEERARLEEQFRQSQKMEAIGRLAGGVAHDMNNVLGAIMGVASALESEMEGDQRIQDVRGILASCRKGRDLTRDLLGFARKGKYLKESISLNELVLEVRNILERTIPKTVEIEVDVDQGLERVEGDSGQLNHALMNICINAADAMRGRGTLTMRTRNVELGPTDVADYQGLRPGRHVLLEVLDTGIGMDASTMERAFEPFFTTKPQGQGTGLGLAMVYGTIKNHAGAVKLLSEIGKGTTVRVLLPVISRPARPSIIGELAPLPEVKHQGTVLLVDDEPMIRTAGKRLLERLGYTVMIAANGAEAVEIYRGSWQSIWLVVLDLVMPLMDGEEAFRQLRAVNPEARILLSSGYSKEEKAEELVSQGAAGFLQKPFDLKALTEELARLIDAEERAARALAD